MCASSTLQMPVMNGQQTIELIKKDLGNEPLPAFIYQTASDRDIRDEFVVRFPPPPPLFHRHI